MMAATAACAGREGARRDRPSRLDRVQAIGVAIADVVDEVHHARQQAEHAEGGAGPPDGCRIAELKPEDQAGEDEDVLRPLAWPQGVNDLKNHRPAAETFGGRTGGGHGTSSHEGGAVAPGCQEYDFSASASESNVSKTVRSFVIDSRSVMRLVRLTSFSCPPCRLTVV